MTLADIWFALFVLIVAAYLILDGFDMGVGILHLPLARTDIERRTFLNSIGPVWDGNEVWLVITGGVLFACFPLVYASLFSGFYLAFMLVLLVMILRTVALEFRSKERSPRWRPTWDTVFWAASLGLALLLGVAFGNVLSGVPIDAQGNMHVTLFDLLNPFALLIGATTVVMLALHGGIYLTMKTEGELLARIEARSPETHARLLRPDHPGRDRDGRLPPADHGAVHRRHLAGRVSRRGPAGAHRRVVVRPPRPTVRGVHRVVRDDRPAPHLRSGRAVSRTC